MTAGEASKPRKRPHLTAAGEWRFDVEPSALRRNRDEFARIAARVEGTEA